VSKRRGGTVCCVADGTRTTTSNICFSLSATFSDGTPASDALFSSQLKLGGFAWQMAEKLHSNLESIFKLKFLMCFGLPKKGTNNKKVLILKLYSVIKTSFGMIEAPTYLLIQS